MHGKIILPLACIIAFWMDEGLLSIISVGCGQLMKMLINLEPHGICGSNYAYLFSIKLTSHMQNDDEALPSIILADRGVSENILEPHHIF